MTGDNRGSDQRLDQDVERDERLPDAAYRAESHTRESTRGASSTAVAAILLVDFEETPR